MILSGQEIVEAIGTGQLVFDPPVEAWQIGSSSVDLRLSNSFTTYRVPSVPGVDTVVDLAQIGNVEEIARVLGTTEVLASGQSFRLEPGGFVLGYTKERVKMPNNLAGRIEGRSSFARLGIAIHQTAPTVHAGWEGQLRLEILNNGPLPCLLSEDLVFCQLVVERLGSPATQNLESIFQNQSQNS